MEATGRRPGVAADQTLRILASVFLKGTNHLSRWLAEPATLGHSGKDDRDSDNWGWWELDSLL